MIKIDLYIKEIVMKKGIIALTIIGIIFFCLIIDIICIFNISRPIFAIKVNNTTYKGIFYDVYNCPEYSIAQIKSKSEKFYPLEIVVDGKLFRCATCYVTIGMTAEAVKLYDEPGMRKKLKHNYGRSVSSYTELIKWYFKNRHRKEFLPQFKLNGELQKKGISDYVAVNGKYLVCGGLQS